MDEVIRRGIHALMKLPWTVTTAEAIEIRRLMEEVLDARAFRINWNIDEFYYDDGSTLIVFVVKHLQKIQEDRSTRNRAFMMTSGAFSAALLDPYNRVEIFQITYQQPEPGEMEENDEGDLYPARPRMLRTKFSLNDMPIPGAVYSLRVIENV